MTNKAFFKHCLSVARHKGILNLVALVHYLEANPEIDGMLGVDRDDALELANQALRHYKQELEIKTYMNK